MRFSIATICVVALAALLATPQGHAQTFTDSLKTNIIFGSWSSHPSGALYRNCGTRVFATHDDPIGRGVATGQYAYSFGPADHDTPEGAPQDIPGVQVAVWLSGGGSASRPGDWPDCGAIRSRVVAAWAGFDVWVYFTVSEGQPVAKFTWDQTDGLTVILDGSDSYVAKEDGSEPVSSYSWSIGDSPSSAINEHTFSAPGEYEVTLTVTNDDGDEDTYTETVLVTAHKLTVRALPVEPDGLYSIGDTVIVETTVENTGLETVFDVVVPPFTDAMTPDPEIPEGASSIRRAELVRTSTREPEQRSSLAVGEMIVLLDSLVVEAYAGYDDVNGEPVDVESEVWAELLEPVQASSGGSLPVDILTPCDGGACESVLVGPVTTDILVNVNDDDPNDPESTSEDICDINRNLGGNQCSLRAAIELATERGGEVIKFDLDAGERNIFLTEALPNVTSNTEIDGHSQPDGGEITVWGTQAGAADGFTLTGEASKVEGLTIIGFDGAGVRLDGEGGHVVAGNHIGTDEGGSSGQGNRYGIVVSSPDNRIGGKGDQDGSVIGGNLAGSANCSAPVEGIPEGAGVYLESSGNSVEGNWIGNDGSSDKRNGHGIFTRASAEIVDNVVSGNSCSGVLVLNESGGTVTVSGNYIGTNEDGNEALPNVRHGIEVRAGNVSIGGSNSGTCEDECNLISGNGDAGIAFLYQNGDELEMGGTVEGNFVGTNAEGTEAIANEIGIMLPVGLPDGASITVGGFGSGWLFDCSSPCNLISGNTTDGIRTENISFGNQGVGLVPGNPRSLTIQGNVIGADVEGQWLRNGGNGIVLGGNPGQNLIGGDTFSLGNAIFYNGGNGVLLRGEVVGEGWNRGTTIRNNRMYRNHAMGIDFASQPQASEFQFLGGDGPTTDLNDNTDSDEGPNGLPNAPLLSVVLRLSEQVKVTGALALSSVMGPDDYTLDFYGSQTCEANAYGEGQWALGSGGINGTNGRFYVSLPPDLVDSKNLNYLTATATDGDGSSSEFSRCIRIGAVGETVEEPILPGGFTSGGGVVIRWNFSSSQTNAHHVVSGSSAGTNDTLYVTRYPEGFEGYTGTYSGIFADSSATSANGVPVVPVASTGEGWHVTDLNATSVGPPYGICLESANVSSTDEVVIVYRSLETGGIFYPVDTHAEEIDGVDYLCSAPIMSLGDFAFGTEATTVHVEPETELPTVFSMAPAYPNPFNPTTNIRLDIPEAGHVHVEVFNMVGKRVAILKDGELPAGTHVVQFEASGFASGVYVVRAITGGLWQTRSITLLK